MKLKKFVCLFAATAMVLCLFTACGASSSAPSAAKAETRVSMDMGAMEAPMENGMLTEESGAEMPLPENRKWIITVNMSAETDDLDTMTAALQEKISALGGFVESQNIYNGSRYEDRRYRSASLTIRIPADNVDQFTESIEGISNVVRKEKNLEDVTLSYVDTESRMNALKTEEARLLELLAQAENMSDLLEIEGRLTDVRGELEQVGSRMRLYDNQIDYATIYLSIDEVQEYTPVEEPGFFARIGTGFLKSLKGLGNSLLDLLVWLIVSLPYILVYGGIVTGIALLVRSIRRKYRMKHPKKGKTE